MDICLVETCHGKVTASGLCRTHYRWKQNGRSFDEPKRVFKHEGLCSTDGCKKEAKLLGFCQNHYRVWKRNGHSNTRVSKLEAITQGGYKVLYAKNPANHLGYREYEHRVVFSKILGRPLLDHENIHHKNGDRLDNRIENLELWSTSQPYGQRVEDKVAWAKELLKLYDPKSLA